MTLKFHKQLSPGIEENSKNFSELSQFVGSEVDDTTGEIIDILAISKTKNIQKIGGKPGFSNIQNIIRGTIGDWGEEKVKAIIPYARNTEKGSLYDIGKGNFNIEVKTTNLGNASVLKTLQIKKLNQINAKVYYSFVFYKIKGGIKPSKLPNDRNKIRRKLEVDSIFLLPIEYIVYANNTLPVVNTLHTPFKKIHRSGVLELFNLAKDNGEITCKKGNIYAIGDIIEFLKK